MHQSSVIDTLPFHDVTLADRDDIMAVTLHSGRRNCNLSIANLLGWQFLLHTKVCILPDTALFQYHIDGWSAYFISSSTLPCNGIIEALRRHAADEGNALRIIALEDTWAEELMGRYPQAEMEPVRNRYDYIYLREQLEQLEGKQLKAKRNHVNKFLSEHSAYRYCDLTPALFDQCLDLAQMWRTTTLHDNPTYGDTLESEHIMLERLFKYWDQLPLSGGAIFVDEELVAFTCGSPVTNDTFDVCIEKANRHIDGAFNIINQQFVKHLPPQYKYINREEDMGLEGLRKAKLSYHPHILLSYNTITIPRP